MGPLIKFVAPNLLPDSIDIDSAAMTKIQMDKEVYEPRFEPEAIERKGADTEYKERNDVINDGDHDDDHDDDQTLLSNFHPNQRFIFLLLALLLVSVIQCLPLKRGAHQVPFGTKMRIGSRNRDAPVDELSSNWNHTNNGKRIPKDETSKNTTSTMSQTTEKDMDNTKQLPPSSRPLPSLEDLMGANNTSRVDEDASIENLLYFTIMAFPKCGTTRLMNWLRRHPSLCVHEGEYPIHTNEEDHLTKLVSMLYHLCPSSNNPRYGKRGYKLPGQLYGKAIPTLIRTHFRNTKLIVGVRHPVLWFQSFYNFRKLAADASHPAMPPMDYFINNTNCVQGVCTERANMHVYLSRLGKTASQSSRNGSLIDKAEASLLQTSAQWNQHSVLRPPLANKVFLYEVTQQDFVNHHSVANQLRVDLSNFLELEEPLKDLGRGPENHQAETRSDICAPHLKPLRDKLVAIGRSSSEWILNYFIPHPDVTISSPEFFNTVLQSWGTDPCEN